MSIYESIFLFTIPIYLISIYKLNQCFLGESIIKKKFEYGLYILYGTLLFLIFMFTRKPIIFLLFNLISFFIISLYYNRSIYQRIVYIFLLYLFLFVIEAVIWRITGFFTLMAFEDSEFNSIVGIILMRVFMLLFAYFIQKYKLIKFKNYNIPICYYIIQFLILLGVLYFFLISLEKKEIATTQIIISSIIVLFINSIVIFMNNKIYEMIYINYERDLFKQQNMAYENQIEMINSSLSTIKSLKHDMKNHIIVLKLLHKNKQNDVFEEYSKRILSEIENNMQFSNTENFIIDSIINFKLQELNSIFVDIKVNVNVPKNLHISAFDLTTILANLLDNAICAVKETKNNRKISIYIHYMKGSLVILIDNSYSTKLRTENGILLTTKYNVKIHGIGLKNVEKALENYNGTMQISCTEKIFSIAVMIPDIKKKI